MPTPEMTQEAAGWIADNLSVLIDDPKQAGFVVTERYLRFVADPTIGNWSLFMMTLNRLKDTYPDFYMPSFYEVKEKK